MLSLFPSLLSYEQVSPLIIRVVLGAVFLFWSHKILIDKNAPKDKKFVAALEFVAGILVVIGLWTQLGALALAIDLLVKLVNKAKNKALLSDGVNYYLLLLVMAISLLFTGAGWIAFDLPL